MRAGLSTIQQTLTPEAATVLNQSISEAARRNHGQTTPLHVATTLLASPAGFLRRACIRSHPNSSHPLQCRALELCFSVALERLPTATATPPNNNDPPISNALMAALKRAQAHQRRGCPEQQQQPLLAVKVELEQLIISILDDPSVSRVMREASFSSPAVKATIEQSLNNSTPTPVPSVGLNFRPGGGGGGAPITRNSYLNPRLQQSAATSAVVNKNDDVDRVMDILGRAKKKNPVLVGDSEPGRVIREIFKKIEVGEVGNLAVKNSEVVHLEEISSDKALRIRELDGLLETRLKNSDPGGGGVILDLGDLKWLVEQPSSTQPPVTVAVEVGRTAVAELRRLLEKFEGRLWFIGTATCETYLRCQVYHPSMETDWDLQAVSAAAKAPVSGVFPRLANNLESFTPLKSFVPANRTLKCCPQCLQSYERELAEIDSVSSPEVVKSEVAQQKQLPQWLLKAKPVDRLPQAKIEEVQKKWNDACVRLHPSFHNKNERIVPIPVPITLSTSSYGPNMLLRQPLQPKLHPNRELRERVQLKPMSSLVTEQAKKKSPPGSPVQTDLVLGRAEDSEKAGDVQVRDFLGCISSESVQNNNKISVLPKENLGNSLDIDLFKKLLKGMTEKVWWQNDAAAAVAATVSQCKLGNGKRRGVLSKGDVWLLFSGPDRVGKRKMASSLSSLVYGTNPTMIQLGSRQDAGDGNPSFRGKTALDKIAETVKRSPFSVILLEDIDEADMLVRGSIKQAMDRGRIRDSHGREISLGNVIFVMTASWHFASETKTSFLDNEAKLRDLASESWRLRLCMREKFGKRRASWLCNDEERVTKPKKEHGSGLSFDLNQAADTDDGSHNTSDLTTDNDQEEQGFSGKLSLQCVPFAFHDLVSRVDDAVAFRAVDFGAVRRRITETLSERFATTVGESLSIEVEDEALQRILSGVWLGHTELEEWIEKAIVPVLSQLKARVSSSGTYGDRTVARLELDEDSSERNNGDLLPTSITLAV
ncbi:PREDICTED: protein SUPPRESSOR OF MAX2 1-like [Camelina sativa]|uniref:Protein SUPPRESSOR OF MAX2 1-like n=1 Tax=Camelina sativa TaxID=90675 RepID=A0ABM0V8Y6_CAMSA|nr:PREDICTED: protein SUPPRESSOR OF MAX2 1-like [Camelina sativa]